MEGIIANVLALVFVSLLLLGNLIGAMTAEFHKGTRKKNDKGNKVY